MNSADNNYYYFISTFLQYFCRRKKKLFILATFTPIQFFYLLQKIKLYLTILFVFCSIPTIAILIFELCQNTRTQILNPEIFKNRTDIYKVERVLYLVH